MQIKTTLRLTGTVKAFDDLPLEVDDLRVRIGPKTRIGVMHGRSGPACVERRCLDLRQRQRFAEVLVHPSFREAVVAGDGRLERSGRYRVRLMRGLDPEVRYDVSVWPETEDALTHANTIERGGDELMRQGLFLDDYALEAQVRGDFQARIFELRKLSA